MPRDNQICASVSSARYSLLAICRLPRDFILIKRSRGGRARGSKSISHSGRARPRSPGDRELYARAFKERSAAAINPGSLRLAHGGLPGGMSHPALLPDDNDRGNDSLASIDSVEYEDTIPRSIV